MYYIPTYTIYNIYMRRLRRSKKSFFKYCVLRPAQERVHVYGPKRPPYFFMHIAPLRGVAAIRRDKPFFMYEK